jgi:hypothetical protein
MRNIQNTSEPDLCKNTATNIWALVFNDGCWNRFLEAVGHFSRLCRQSDRPSLHKAAATSTLGKPVTIPSVIGARIKTPQRKYNLSAAIYVIDRKGVKLVAILALALGSGGTYLNLALGLS